MIERDLSIQKQRLKYAKSRLNELGIEVFDETENEIKIRFKGETIKIYPYTGWFTGKPINDGRGIHNLIKQINSYYERKNREL